MGLTDFIFGSNDASKAASKAAAGAEFSPYLYAGPGGSLSGFGTIAPTPAGAAPTVNGTPSISNQGLPGGGIVGSGGLIDTGYKSDGHGLPIQVDPNTGKTYVMWKGALTPATGGVIGPDGKKTTIGANGTIAGYQVPQVAAPAPATAPGQKTTQAIAPTTTAPTAAPGGSSSAPQALASAFGGVTGAPATGPAPPGTTIAPTNIPGQTAFGDLGNLNPIQQGNVDAYGQVVQQGIRDVANVNPNVTPAASPYDAFGDVYNQNLSLLRQQAAPQEDQAYNALQNKLYSQGRLGSTGGGLDITAFAKGLGEADVARQLAAFNTAQGVAGQQEAARQYDTNVAQNNVTQALNQGNLTFTQAMQLFSTLPQLNQIGSSNFTNALNAAIARSNANAGAATVLGQQPADNGAFGSILGTLGSVFQGQGAQLIK